MSLDLHKGARPDERFHLQTGYPVATVKTWWIFAKRVTWSHLFLPDGTPGHFTSWWFFGNAMHWYHGNVKCDGTRTRMYWYGQLDDGVPPRYDQDRTQYVMTTTEKEYISLRWFVEPRTPLWDNMGGA